MDKKEVIEILIWAAKEHLEYLEQTKEKGYVHPFLDKDIENLKNALLSYTEIDYSADDLYAIATEENL